MVTLKWNKNRVERKKLTTTIRGNRNNLRHFGTNRAKLHIFRGEAARECFTITRNGTGQSGWVDQKLTLGIIFFVSG